MSDLDIKLRIILENPVHSSQREATIAQIKQAFADEQMTYKSNPEAYSHIFADFSKGELTKLMTGQEWYNQFSNEFRGTPAGTLVTLNIDEIMKAAKRASGIDTETQ